MTLTQKIRYELIKLLAGKDQIMMNVDFVRDKLVVKKPAFWKKVRFLVSPLE